MKTESNQNILTNLVIRNLKLKYKNSVLGYLWSLITPLVYLAIFNFVFGAAFGSSMNNYSLYVVIGLVLWMFFNNASNEIIASIGRNSSIIKAISTPMIIFPLSAILTEGVSTILTFIVFGILMFFFGFQISMETLLVIPFLALFAIFTFGISLFLSVLNVYFRDISILWSTVNPALFYITPIAYSLDIVPEKYHWILKLNPLYFYFDASRSILFSNENPSLTAWSVIILLSTTALALGYFTLTKLKNGLASNL
jgi:ABC-2 type transport system permease protein